MNAHKEQISKISRPKPAAVFQRKRLFKLLNKKRKHPAIWISGPAGAGKTALITSYIESKNIDCIWYQVDARDTDPATFFYYMGLAAKKASPRKRKPLPLLTPEYMLGLDTFALRFFEAVYQRLYAPAILVIDNYQIIPQDSFLHSLILNGLSIIPEDIMVIIISRESPPPVFSRMLANQKMTHIEWQQIQLTLEETEGITRLQTQKKISKSTINHLHKASDGWAAGLMLMLTHAEMDGIDWQSIQEFTSQEIFDYLGKEVFEKVEPKIQEFLLKVSLLPHMTVHMAKTLTGHTRAGQILSALNRNNQFTERRFQKRLSYQFHPLFREFLLSRFIETYSEEKRVDLYRTAAALLQDEGDIEEAAALLRNAKALVELADLIINHSPSLISQGRNQTLLEWLGFLPKEMVTQIPWLGYWMGAALIPFDPEAARELLEKAFHAFQSRKDASGLFLSWSGIVRAIFFKMSDISPLDHWIEVLEELIAEHQQLPNKEIEGHVVSSMLMALGHRQMHHPSIKSWINRAHALLSDPLNLNIKVSIINNAAHYYFLIGDFNKATQMMDMLGPAMLSNHIEPKGAIVNLTVLALSCFYYCYVGQHAECLDTVTKSLEISKKTGVYILKNIITGYGIWSALIHEQNATARELFENNADSFAKAGPLDRSLIDFVRSLEAISMGNLKQAASYATSALESSLDVGLQFCTIFCHLINARVSHEMRQYEEAAKHLKKAFQLSKMTRARYFMFHALMLEARFDLDCNRIITGIKSLRKALALGKEIGLYHNAIDSRSAVTQLCTVALEQGIEEEYVKKYIHQRNLIPDTSTVPPENWPWPLKIFTLGRFNIVKDGAPIKFTTKTQKKPLEMIKVLIALGGWDVSKDQISDVLWPNADGDKANRAFITTLHRLRRLLGNDQAVLIQEGKLTLNSSVCWVDCWAFERLMSQADEAKNEDKEKAMELTEKALSIYKSAFLAGDDWAPWAVSQKERLRSKFIQAVDRYGKHLESMNQLEKAVAYYHRSLDADDISEETYQCLMQCLIKLGRKTEAISVYNRCEKTLHASLGMAPSLETQSIYQSLLDG